MCENSGRDIVCKICGERVKARKSTEYSGYPKQHKNLASGDNCHGFFGEGLVVK